MNRMSKRTVQIAGLWTLVTAIALTLPLLGQVQGQRAGRGGQGAAAPPPAPQPTTGQGKLILFADLALFADPTVQGNCFLRNRFRRGEGVGFRITAVDGGSGNPETSAAVVVQVTYAGRSVDIPAEPRMLGGPKPYYPNIWTAKWVVPKDAPTGIVRYKVTAKDKYGRTAEWNPFPAEPSLLTVVE